MSLPNQTTVLIVGAGPAGLSAALSLVHHGCRDFVIVDAQHYDQNFSRAAIIHSATMEALDSIGVGDDILSQGLKTGSFDINTRSTKLSGPWIERLTPYTKHPYVLIIAQSMTERIIEKKLASLGVTVRRPFKVVGVSSNVEDPNLSDATFEDGTVMKAKYVIGADGARSTIRSVTGIGFSDPTLAKYGSAADTNLAQMAVADITLEGDSMEDLGSSLTLSPESLFFSFSLPWTFNEFLATEKNVSVSERIYRIGYGVPLEEGEVPHAPSKEYLQPYLDRFGPSINPKSKELRIKEVVASSRFRNRAAIADTVFTRVGGAVLLIGDAAHIHSPAGGQGMNLSIRDGVFAGEALTAHILASKTQAIAQADVVLREFAAVRHKHALEVIKFTKRIISFSGKKYRKRTSWWLPIDSATVRDWTLWVFGNMAFVQKRMAWALSGLGRR